MVERVAHALQLESMDSLSPGQAENLARAAIAAMKEPTDAMLDEGFDEGNIEVVARAWRVMIDAALK